MENQSVFSLITRLCEKFLDSKERRTRVSSRTAHLKKLRSTSYGILLKPVDGASSVDPHESFVNAISAHIQNGIEQEQIYTEEFDKCIEHLWLETSRKPFISSVVYFLSKLHNESLSLDGDLQMDALNRDSGHSDVRNSLPKKYHLYHPSLFILPKLENYVVRDSKFLCSPSVPDLLHNQATAHPPICLQLNFTGKRDDPKRKSLSSQMNPFLRDDQDAADEYGHQFEDEGYVSHGATPLGISPGGWCGIQWDEVGVLDKVCEKKGTHRTWESLGEASPGRELPTLMEAGAKALHCQLKIQECLILTMEPSVWSPPKNSTSYLSFFQQVMYLLIGVESECFIFNEKLNAFELLSGTWIEGLSHEALALYSQDFIIMGTCFRRLADFSEPPTCPDTSEGIIQQAIRRSMKTYLNFYSGASMVVMQSLLKKSSLSFLLVKSKIRILQQKIIGLARAFGKWDSGNSFPSGVGALGHLYRHSYGAQRKELVYSLRYILNSACRAYFSLLEKWVYSGELVDEGDFFVGARMEYISYRSRRYWTRAFSVNSVSVPEFLSGLEPLLLRCGKSVHFLKLCDPKNAVLEDSLNLSGLKSEQMTSLDRDEVEKTISMRQAESETSHPNLKSFGSDDTKVVHQGVQEDLTASEEFDAVNEEKGDEVITGEAVPSCDDINIPQEAVSKDVKKVPLIPSCSEDELRFKAVRDAIIDEYAKSSAALEKRRMRADWRRRRLQLRTKKISPSLVVLQNPSLSATVKPNIHKNTEDDACVDLDLLVKSEREAQAESQPTLLSNVAEDVKGEGNLPEFTPQEITSVVGPIDDSKLSEEENNSREMNVGDKTENKLGEKTDSITGVSCATLSVSNISKHEELMVHSDAVELKEESGKSQESADSHECVSSEGSDSGTGKVVESLSKDNCKPESCLDDDFVSSIISFPPASISFSPKRTPLKKVDGLFSFSRASEISRTDEESTEADEAEKFDWPFRHVLVSLISHSRKVDAALLKWLLVDKGLISHLHSLRAYFFLLDGEFGRRLSEDLFSAMRHKPGKKPSVECLNVVSLNTILSHALASSTHAVSDPNASLLSMTLQGCPAQASAMEQLGSIQMIYDAPWPLNVVLTDEALSKYSRVLDLLLRLKHASWALEDVFMHMRIIDPMKGNKQAFSGGRRSPSGAFHHSHHYRTLQLFRHQMLNLIKAVQSYITAEVLKASGKRLEEAIANSSCLDEFYAEHVLYVKRILFGCMLNKRSETISTIINDILKLVMKFHWSLCSRSWVIPNDQGNGENFNLVHPNFKVLTRIYDAFEEMTTFLFRYAWRLAHHGYHAQLHSLLLMINANNYYKLENGCDGGGKEHESSITPG
ncbi:uncharacterized protein Grip163 [Hetaerina americana]|uniref:uncharacterized protein Grip163 n=1 Tax=Hetaerina americana TaxID=62018 RepID=UPI003A7F1715